MQTVSDRSDSRDSELAVRADTSDSLQEAFAGIDPEERIAAIRELSDIDEGEAATILGDLLARDRNVMVRREAVLALDNIGGDAAVAAISNGLGDEDGLIRHQTITALWNQGSHTVHLIGQALFGDPDPALRYRAVELLAADASPAAMAFVHSATEDPDADVRHIARQSTIQSAPLTAN